jgi:hypothetical protein
LELAGWYQKVPYLRLKKAKQDDTQLCKAICQRTTTIRVTAKEKRTLPNGWRKHDNDRSLDKHRCNMQSYDRSSWKLTLDR